MNIKRERRQQVKTVLREFRDHPQPIEKTEHTVEGCDYVVDVKLPARIVWLAEMLAKDDLKLEGAIKTAMDETRFKNKIEQRTIGKKGELALAAHLYADWTQALDYMMNRYGPDNEFNSYLFDVKTDGTPRRAYMNLQVPENQCHPLKYDFYVGCCLQAFDLVRIWGYATRTELEHILPEDKGYGPDRNIPYRNLHRPLREIKSLPQKPP